MGHLQVLSFFLLSLQISLFAKQLEVQIETPYALLMNVQTGKVIYEKRGRDNVYPASTTKIASALYLLANHFDKIEDTAVCSENALRVVSENVKKEKGSFLPPYILELDGTSMNLKKNEKVSLKQLLYGMLLSSGNDASNVAAEFVCGDVDTFVGNVNKLAREIGCKNTHFMNPHGLFHSNHKTSAYDMALLTREALKFPLFRQIVATSFYKEDRREFNQGNALVKPDSPYYYPFAIGIKTGYIRSAKYNLVAAANNGEREIIAVLHKSPTSKQRYEDAISLFNAAFSELPVKRLMFRMDETQFQKEIPKAQFPVTAVLNSDLYLNYFPSEEEEITAKLEWFDLNLPIVKESVVAKLILISKNDGRVLLTEVLFAKEKVNMKLIYAIMICIKTYLVPIIVSLLLIGLAGGSLFLRLRKDK